MGPRSVAWNQTEQSCWNIRYAPWQCQGMRKLSSHAPFAANPRSVFVNRNVSYEWLATTLVMYTFPEGSQLANACNQHQFSLVKSFGTAKKWHTHTPSTPGCLARVGALLCWALKQDLGWKVPGIDVQLLSGFWLAHLAERYLFEESLPWQAGFPGSLMTLPPTQTEWLYRIIFFGNALTLGFLHHVFEKDSFLWKQSNM